MSQRDRRLLDEAGISIAGAAELFGRSRQAFYTGLANERDYFSPQDVVAILNDAQRRDFNGLSELIHFVESSYADQRDLIVPERIGLAQLERVIADAKWIVLSTNGNTDHLKADANFATTYMDVSKRRADTLHLVLPSEWVVGYIEQNTPLHLPNYGHQVSFRPETANLPSFVAAEDNAGRRRAFMFGRLGVEELLPGEAEKLWLFLVPTSGWRGFPETFVSHRNEPGDRHRHQSKSKAAA